MIPKNKNIKDNETYVPMSVNTIKKLYGVSELEAWRIYKHYASYEEYPKNCSIIEKEIFEDKNGDTFARLIRASGVKKIY